ncbi:MAG: hypothetical protein SVK44_08630 [Nitrospirota bacterium]|nr:hypothetical protein [Nitrospirota bacterium]
METIQQSISTFMPMHMQSMMTMGRMLSSIPAVGAPMQNMMFFMMKNFMHPMCAAIFGMAGLEIPPITS